MYELIQEASNVLRNPTTDFDFDNPPEDPKEIEKNMAEAMEKYGGLGLSANQVGLHYKMFVMKTADKVTVGFFNGKITRASQETEMMKEGCLSFPDLYLMIKRAKTIEFEYQDVEGEKHTLILEGMGARVVQHELDHLNGIVFLQRASRLKIERALKARPKEKRRREEYQKRVAIARFIQEQQSAKTSDDSESSESSGSTGTDSVSQES